ncbi:hypothetical protein C8Q73DRAFT_378792 [Cubamyces lactineus]|nr:hypothetical protein C8Q73DRAFT_378792 [Cubamyces lactineus]
MRPHSPQKLAPRVRTRRASPARCIIVSRLYQDPHTRLVFPCLEAADADDHTDYRIAYSLYSFLFTLLHPALSSFSYPSHTLSSCTLSSPPPGGAYATGMSKVDTELPGTSRSCAARSRLPLRVACTGEQRSRKSSTWRPRIGSQQERRHDTTQDRRMWLEARASIVTHAVSPPARTSCFSHPHGTVVCRSYPARPSLSRLAHAVADGDDHLTVVPCLAAAHVRADTLASNLLSSPSRRSPSSLDQPTLSSLPLRHLPSICPVCSPVHLRPGRRLITASGLRCALPSCPAPPPFFTAPGTSDTPMSSGSSSWCMRASDKAQFRQHALAHGALSQGWKTWRGAGLSPRRTIIPLGPPVTQLRLTSCAWTMPLMPPRGRRLRCCLRLLPAPNAPSCLPRLSFWMRAC